MKIMKMHNHFLQKIKNISENEFLNFYFLNVDISFNIHDLSLKLFRCIQYIAVEGTVSQNFYTGPCSFFIKFRKKYSDQKSKSCPFFYIK